MYSLSLILCHLYIGLFLHFHLLSWGIWIRAGDFWKAIFIFLLWEKRNKASRDWGCMQYCSVRASLVLLTLLKFHGFCVNTAVLLWPLSNSQLLLSWVWALYINCRVKFWPQRQNSTKCWLLLTVLCIPNDSLEDLPPVPPFLKCPT